MVLYPPLLSSPLLSRGERIRELTQEWCWWFLSSRKFSLFLTADLGSYATFALGFDAAFFFFAGAAFPKTLLGAFLAFSVCGMFEFLLLVQLAKEDRISQQNSHFRKSFSSSETLSTERPPTPEVRAAR